MADTLKCACASCGAKYRLPLEAQGRTVRCKQCGTRFEVPRQKAANLEDSIMAWLSAPDDDEVDETLDRPRVVNLPAEKTADSADDSAAGAGAGATRGKGIIRYKTGNSPS